MERETKRRVHVAAFIVGALVIVTAPGPCFGQVARETWQPPEKILDAIGVKPGMRVGEAGAGRGYFTFSLARRVGPGGVVYANDISTSSLDVIRERADSEGLKNIKIVVGAVEDPLFPEKNLDMVAMVYVLHEVERQVPFLKSLRSYLKPGGLLVIIEGNSTGGSMHTPPFMTSHQVFETLREAGYELDRTETFLPRDTIYIYRAPAPSGVQLGGIHDAAAAGDLEKVKALLDSDPALLESRDKDGETPLIKACMGVPDENTQATTARFLIDKGADVNASGPSGRTPLMCVNKRQAGSLDLLQRLIAKGADVNASMSYTTRKWTVFCGAAKSGNIKAARLFIEHGADINTRDIEGTPLQMAIHNNRPISGSLADDRKLNEAMAVLLVESGAKRQEFSFGNTDLHLAAIRGFADLVRALVRHGADVNAVNDYGHSPLYYAARHGYRKAAEALLAAGADKGAMTETNYGKAPQLTAPLGDGEAYLWYLASKGSPNTGYAIKTRNNLLIFDPAWHSESLEAGLANGCLNSNELAGQKIAVLIGHQTLSGSDISELAKRVPGASFVLSFQPGVGDEGSRDMPPYRLATAHESFSVGGVQVRTIPAASRLFGKEGLGYLVEADGLKIFHAGLHFSDNNSPNVATFREEIDFLKPFGPIDIAILPIKGRHLESLAYEPYLYLIDQLSPRAIYLIGEELVTEEPKKCLEVLKARNVPVFYPEGGVATGERFHYLRDQKLTTPPTKTEALSLSGAYLGQPLPGEMPQVFAPGVVSTDDQQHGAPTFSPDGNEVFWQTNRLDSEKKWHVSVMTMRRVRDQWTPPEVSPYEGEPVFSPDGQRLYFDSKGEGDDPYFLEKQGDGWGDRKYVRIVSRFPELKFAYNLSIAHSGTLYFLGHAGGLGLWNDYGLYRSELVNGEYAKPELLSSSINVPGALNWTPFIAPDESYLIFCSRRMTPKDDYGDLYVCFRQPDGTWTDRVSLGEPINSKVLERFPTVSPDGKYLFFTRWTPDHDEDVFWVSAGVIEQLKAKTVQEQRLKSVHRQEGPK